MKKPADGFIECFLVGFDREEVIGPHFLDDQPGGFLIGVEGIEDQHLAS